MAAVTAAPAPPATIESLEESLRNNPIDYYKWEEYIAKIEADSDKNKVKAAYEQLLQEFPLMYGFWKKLADITYEIDKNIDTVIQTYEKAVEQVLYSVEMWTHYCVFVAEKSNDLDQIRSTFERAVNKVGNDFLAHTLWDQYIAFETSQEELLRLSLLYERLLQIPLRDLTRYYTKYGEHAAPRRTGDLDSTEQIQQLTQKHQIEEAVRIAIAEKREAYYKASLAELERITPFETGVERPYFHVQPMDEKQLQNWRRYLQTEGSRTETSHQRMNNLYLKCLVSCCLYNEFWSGYVRYLEDNNHEQEARLILTKLTNIYRRRDQESYILHATFEERRGQIDAARAIFKSLIASIGKADVSSVLQYIHFERRNISQQENNAQQSQVAALFTTLQEGMDAKSCAYMDVQRAKFLISTLGDLESARGVYEDLIASEASAYAFVWLSLIETEAGLLNANTASRLNPLLNKVVTCTALSKSDKTKVLNRLLEYSYTLDNQVSHARLVEREILNLAAAADDTEESRGVKKKAEDSVDERDAKVPRSASPNTLAQQQQYAQYLQQQQYAAYYQQMAQHQQQTGDASGYNQFYQQQ